MNSEGSLVLGYDVITQQVHLSSEGFPLLGTDKGKGER